MNKRRVFITGGAHGIGRAMVEAFCQEGNDFINGQTITIDGGVTRKMIYPD